MKLVILPRERTGLVQSIEGVQIVEMSYLYSLQTDVMEPHVGTIDKVVIVDMAVRYHNVVEFLRKHALPVYELHSKGSQRGAEIAYEQLSVEYFESLDEVVERINSL